MRPAVAQVCWLLGWLWAPWHFRARVARVPGDELTEDFSAVADELPEAGPQVLVDGEQGAEHSVLAASGASLFSHGLTVGRGYPLFNTSPLLWIFSLASLGISARISAHHH